MSVALLIKRHAEDHGQYRPSRTRKYSLVQFRRALQRHFYAKPRETTQALSNWLGPAMRGQVFPRLQSPWPGSSEYHRASGDPQGALVSMLGQHPDTHSLMNLFEEAGHGDPSALGPAHDLFREIMETELGRRGLGLDEHGNVLKGTRQPHTLGPTSPLQDAVEAFGMLHRIRNHAMEMGELHPSNPHIQAWTPGTALSDAAEAEVAARSRNRGFQGTGRRFSLLHPPPGTTPQQAQAHAALIASLPPELHDYLAGHLMQYGPHREELEGMAPHLARGSLPHLLDLHPLAESERNQALRGVHLPHLLGQAQRGFVGRDPLPEKAYHHATEGILQNIEARDRIARDQQRRQQRGA